MPKHRCKSTSEDDEVRSQKSHYTNVSKNSSKHVELSLEVQIDDEVREIIKSPEKCPSALLDVTVIKPKGIDTYTSEKQILKTEQVRQMLASMKLDTNQKKVLMEKLFGEYTEELARQRRHREDKKDGATTTEAETNQKRIKSCLSSKCKQAYRAVSAKMDQGDCKVNSTGMNTTVCTMYNQPSYQQSLPDYQTQHQQVYTSTPRTHEDIKSMFTCKNKDKDHNDTEKTEPCMCHNCAVVGVLTDSQKKPFATEPIPEPLIDNEAKYRKPQRKKSVSFKQLENLKHLEGLQHTVHKPQEHEQCKAIFQALSARINDLEKRVAIQEEKSVPKDYFKKIITKLVNHLSKLTHFTAEERIAASPHRHRERDRDTSPNSFCKYRSSDKKYYVNPVLVENTYKVPAEKEYDPKPCSSSEPPETASESLWKWGEDIFSSGRDLRNKVVVLLEDTIQHIKKGFEKPESQTRLHSEIKNMVDELTNNLKQNLRLEQNAKLQPTKRSGGGVQQLDPRKKTMTLKAWPQERHVVLDKKMKKPSLIPRFMRRNGAMLNVAYVNPEAKSWPDSSAVSFKIDSSDNDAKRENMCDLKRIQYRRQFQKVLDNTKRAERFKLWQNIWNQALENRQTKNDFVAIQIPDPKDLMRKRMIHLDYTIGELEKLLTDPRQTDDKRKTLDKQR